MEQKKEIMRQNIAAENRSQSIFAGLILSCLLFSLPLSNLSSLQSSPYLSSAKYTAHRLCAIFLSASQRTPLIVGIYCIFTTVGRETKSQHVSLTLFETCWRST